MTSLPVTHCSRTQIRTLYVVAYLKIKVPPYSDGDRGFSVEQYYTSVGSCGGGRNGESTMAMFVKL